MNDEHPLQQVFMDLFPAFDIDPSFPARFWAELKHKYEEKTRHYHTLSHLQHMYEELSGAKAAIEDWTAILSALFYHDSIYSSSASDNEEKSAELASTQLHTAHFPKVHIYRCVRHIMATKQHALSEDSDTNHFTDADLSILGSNPDRYDAYAQQIRQEYRRYPDLIYRPGRRKVLKHFLDMPQIYKTAFFKEKYEHSARINIQRELDGR